MTESEFSSFDDALKQLELDEDDLKRLISAGEIRAFREGSKMRLRIEDVDRVAGELGIGEAVSESDAGEVLEVEDLMLDDGDDDAGMITTQLSEEDTLLDDDLEVVEVDVEDAPARSGGAVAGASRTRRGAAAKEEAAAAEGGGMLAALVITTVLMIFAIPFAIGMVAARTTGVTSSVVDLVAGK